MAYIRHDFEKIGKRIKDEREALGISSLDKMSEKLDNDYSYKISRQALSNIEKGHNTRAFTVDLIDIFCEMFQCDAAYLLCEYDDCKTYDKQFIHEYTGLSEEAIEQIELLNNVEGAADTLNDMFRHGLFNTVIGLKEGRKNLNKYLREKEESLKRSRHLQENPQIMEDKEKVSRSAEKMGEFLINTKLCVLNAQNRFLSIIQKLIPIDD